MINVKPYKHTYFIYNRAEGVKYTQEYTATELAEFIHNNISRYRVDDHFSDNLKRAGKIFASLYVYDPKTRSSQRRWYLKPNTRIYCILNDLGDIVDVYDLFEIAKKDGYKPRRKHHGYRQFDYPEYREKNNFDKIKKSCKYKRWLRQVSTTNERRQNIAHVKDYGQKFVRGKRMGKNLVCSWDDIPVSMTYAEKSWKHNSKRRKQWKL